MRDGGGFLAGRWLAREEEPQMKEAVVLMRFLRHDPVGQRFGVAAAVIAWFAVAWTSLTFFAAVPITLGVAEYVRRKREENAVEVDELEDLY
jgi:hypothetical protein